MTTWKPIPSNTNYEASNEGQIRNAKTKHILQPSKNNVGYLLITLQGGQSSRLVSRLVAETFIPNPDNKPEIDHIDSNSLNNSVDNLRWVTRSENLRNPHRKEALKAYWNSEEGQAKREEIIEKRPDTYQHSQEYLVKKEQAFNDKMTAYKNDFYKVGLPMKLLRKKYGSEWVKDNPLPHNDERAYHHLLYDIEMQRFD